MSTRKDKFALTCFKLEISGPQQKSSSKLWTKSNL